MKAPFSLNYRRLLMGGVAALLGVGCVLLYWHTAGFDFVLLDDDVNIFFNPHLGLPTLSRMHWMWTDYEYVRRYIPVGWMGLSAIYSISGLNPAGYHLTLVALHEINAMLLYGVLLKLWGWVAVSTGDKIWPALVAGLVAAAWAVNPMGLESIAWASGLLHAQALCFCLLALLVYAGLHRETTQGWRRAARGIAALLLYTCSLLSYPIALGVMPALIGLEYWLTRRSKVGTSTSKSADAIRFFGSRIGFFVVPAVVLGITVFSRYRVRSWGEVPDMWSTSLAERLAQSSYVLTYYLWKPWLPFDLSPIYTSLIAIDPRAERFLVSMGAVGLVVLACIVWPAFRRKAGPWLAAYVAMMIPFLGLTEKPHIAYDRYAILPGALMAIVGVLLLGKTKAAWGRGLTCVIGLGVIVTWASLSYRQSWIWKDSLTLHRYIASRLPDREFPLFKYRRPAFALFTYGREAEAVALIKEGQARFPEDGFIEQTARDFAGFRTYYDDRSDAAGGHVIPLAIQHVDAGLVAIRQHQWREGEEHFRCAVALAPTYSIAAYDQALSLLELNRTADALHSYLRAKAEGALTLSMDSQRIFLGLLSTKAAELSEPRLAAAATRRQQAVLRH